MWESVDNGVTTYECRTNEAECRAGHKVRKEQAQMALAIDFFATFGVSKDELTTKGQPQYRDAHQRYVHPPTGRVFKHPIYDPDSWTEVVK